jgi:hypothetical protein
MAINELEEKHDVQIHIDQKPYQSPNPTTGEALYILGHVQAGLELYRDVGGDKEDAPISNGTETVHLKEDEHFHSGPPKVYTIIVNGRKKEVAMSELSFDQIVHLAFDPVPTGPNVLITVEYGHGPKANPQGTLLEGGTVKIKDGMVFSVSLTDKS